MLVGHWNRSTLTHTCGSSSDRQPCEFLHQPVDLMGCVGSPSKVNSRHPSSRRNVSVVLETLYLYLHTSHVRDFSTEVPAVATLLLSAASARAVPRNSNVNMQLSLSMPQFPKRTRSNPAYLIGSTARVHWPFLAQYIPREFRSNTSPRSRLLNLRLCDTKPSSSSLSSERSCRTSCYCAARRGCYENRKPHTEQSK